MKAKPISQKFKQVSWNLLLICVGSALCAVAVNGILIPKEFLSAGFTGLALVIHYLVPAMGVSWIYILLNVPLFLLGWSYVGRRFFLYSIAGMVIFSAALQWVTISIQVQDKMLSALLAGIISGTGGGIILRSLGSAGGLDILSVILLKRFSIRLGSSILAFNAVLLGTAVFLTSIDRVLYTLVFVYVTSHGVTLVVTGLSKRHALFVISPRWKEISRRILEEPRLGGGITILPGEGGYTGKEEKILYAIIAFRDLFRVKQIIKRLDPQAFLVVTDTLEVEGQRIEGQAHW
jgi:uncharacterized membrane-anchored protein YitT (DUF2179 family)